MLDIGDGTRRRSWSGRGAWWQRYVLLDASSGLASTRYEPFLKNMITSFKRSTAALITVRTSGS